MIWQTILINVSVILFAAWSGNRAGKRAYRKAQEREYRAFNYRPSDVPLTRKQAHQAAKTLQAVEKIQQAIEPDYVPYSKPLTVGDKRQIDRIMTRYIEQFPESPFFTEHPQFKEDYLNKIDLGELGFGKADRDRE